MIRLIGVVVGAALIGYPPFLIYAITVRVPRFRTGSYVDFLPFAVTLLAIYGGVLLGIAVHWLWRGRSSQRVRPFEVFIAGVYGTLAVGVVFLASAGVRGVMTQGSFEKGIGNLWGLVLIFAGMFGALVSGGVALLFRFLRSPRDTRFNT
jgi:hypothetical protein